MTPEPTSKPVWTTLPKADDALSTSPPAGARLRLPLVTLPAASYVTSLPAVVDNAVVALAAASRAA